MSKQKTAIQEQQNCETRTLVLPKAVSAFVLKKAPSIEGAIERIHQLHNEEDVAEMDIMLEGTEQVMRILRGYLFRHYRQISEPRKFLELLKKRGISTSTAYDYMDEAAVFDRLADEQACENISALGSMKIRALKKLGAKELNDFAGGSDINGLSYDRALTVNADEFSLALKDELAQTKKKAERLQAKLEKVEEENHALQTRVDLRYEYSDAPDFYTQTQHEAQLMAAQVELALESYSELFDDNIRTASLENNEKSQGYCESSLATIYTNVQAIAGRFNQLAQHMFEQLPSHVGENIDAHLPNEIPEVEVAIARYNSMLSNFRAEQKKQQAKNNKLPKKRGRPAKKGSAK